MIDLLFFAGIFTTIHLRAIDPERRPSRRSRIKQVVFGDTAGARTKQFAWRDGHFRPDTEFSAFVEFIERLDCREST